LELSDGERPWDDIVARLDAGDREAVRELLADFGEVDRNHAAAHLSSGDLARLLAMLGV
jgi:hypothetical protein